MATSFFYIYVMATSFFYIYVMATSFFYIYIDIYIDIYITFTNWRSVQLFYWTPFVNVFQSANNYIQIMMDGNGEDY